MSTEQPKPLTGYRETQETKKEVTVDPKKFQEELSKVQESEQSQQRDKRNLKKSEEEGEEDEQTARQNLIKASGALFALFMKESSTDLLTPQTPQNIRGSAAPTTTSQFTIEQDDSLGSRPQEQTEQLPQTPTVSTKPQEGPIAPPPLPTFSQNILSSSEESEENFQGERPSAPAYPQQAEEKIAPPPFTPLNLEQSQQSQQPQTEEPSDTTSPVRVEKKEKEKDTSLLGKEKKTKAAHIKKEKEKSPDIHLKKREEPAQIIKKEIKSEKHPEEKKEPEKQKPIEVKQKPLGIKAHEEVQEEEKTKKLEKELPSTLVESTQAPPTLVEEKKPPLKVKESINSEALDKPKIKTEKETSQDSSKKDKEKEEDKTSSTPITPIPLLSTFTPPPTPPVPAYANLSPQVFELFERMVGLVSIQETKGMTTTTVTVNMKNSIFDGTQIIIDHYETAPNALNITIAGNPKAQEMINQNMTNLVASFEASKLSFQVNLRRPVLLEDYQTFKRKEKVGAEQEQDEQPQEQ